MKLLFFSFVYFFVIFANYNKFRQILCDKMPMGDSQKIVANV